MDSKTQKTPRSQKKGVKSKGSGSRYGRLVALDSDTTSKLISLIRQSGLVKGAQQMIGNSQDIPYGPAIFMKGTQAPVIRLYLLQQLITTTATTIYNTVLQITAQLFTNYGDMAVAFEEYRVLRGELEYHTVTQIGNTTAGYVTNSFGIGLVDYGSTTALASFDAANGHDTKRFFNLSSFPGARAEIGEAMARWPLAFEKQPDQDWLPVGSSTTTFCTWKPYFPAASVLATGTTGYLLGWMDFQFRGMSS